jgi:tRNA A37 N6-isopentenylltransferase MiaA
MTLENVIFKNDGQIVFIDVLDSDLETFWMDIAKLLYDIEISWSLRTSLWQTNHSSEERLLSMLSRYLADEVRIAIEQNFPAVIPHLSALKAIQALRVLPYSHNEQTLNRLTEYIGSLPL